MPTKLPPLPPGFTLDPVPETPNGIPPLPPGFTLDPVPEGRTGTPQMQGALRLPAMAASNLATGAAQGVGFVGDLQNLIQRGVDIPADYVSRHLFGVEPPANHPESALSSSALTGYGKAAGVMDRPDLQPQNTGERYLEAGAQGVGRMVPAGMLAAGSAIPNAIRGAVEGVGAGTGGEALAEAFPDHPTLARLGGNILGALTGAGLFNVGNRVAGAAMGASTPTLDAYRQLGINPELGGDVTGNTGMQQLQAFASKAPGGAGRIAAASGRAVDQWGNALETTAANYGTAGTLQDAGAALQMEGKQWLSNFKDASQKAWSNVAVRVPGDTPAPASNYAATLSAVRQEMPQATETANVLQPALSKNLADALAKDIQGGPLTFRDLTSIRTRIGERLADPQLVADTGYAELKRLYGALSDDMAAVVAQKGPEAQAAFDNASTLTRNGHSFIEGVLSNVIKGDKITPEQAAQSALSQAGKGGTTLGELRAEMPQAADELAGFKLRNMGLANPGAQTADASRLSPGGFLTNLNKMAPEARDALFGGDPRVGALAKVGESMRGTEQFVNRSNTAPTLALGNILTSLPFGLAGFGAGYGAGGPLAGAAGAVLPLAAGYGAARAATSPLVNTMLGASAAQMPAAPLFNTAASAPEALRALLEILGQSPPTPRR